MMPDSLERAQRIAETVLREQLNDFEKRQSA